MTGNWLRNFLLLVIAVSLVMIALRPYIAPQPVFAESGSVYPIYIEPGTTALLLPGGTGTTGDRFAKREYLGFPDTQ